MAYSLTKYERETHTFFNEEEDFAIIDTHSKKWIHALEKSGAVAYHTDQHGGKRFRVPLSWVRVPRPPKKTSEKQRENARRLHEYLTPK